VLEIRHGPGIGEATRLPADRVLSIGRDRHADLRLNHRSVSRHHAEIHPQDGGYVLVDAEAANGTHLRHGGGQAPVTRARLAEGGSVIVGVFALTYHGPA
jgi:pSer/pThr/pTyr-binding forkhead associated (FHA) protein